MPHLREFDIAVDFSIAAMLFTACITHAIYAVPACGAFHTTLHGLSKYARAASLSPEKCVNET